MKINSIMIIMTFLLISGCNKEPESEKKTSNTRPVSVISLEEKNFSREVSLTGSVNLYRQEKVGFEVSGRIFAVQELGIEVEGPAYDENNTIIRAGDVIASMDNTRYRLIVEALEEKLNAAYQTLKSTEATLTLAKQTLDRRQGIYDRGVGDKHSVDTAKSQLDSTLAQKAQNEAVIREITENLKRAKEDLEDTKLRAPFTGRITDIHVTQGAVVEAGTPVVTLSLMDPIQVHVEVSADDDRRIQTGDRAMLYPSDPIDPNRNPIPVHALVYEKDAIADPNTRTFRIDLMARNERRRIDQVDKNTIDLPLVSEFLPVVKQYQGEEGDLFVPVDSIYFENGKSYVMTLPGVSFHAGSKRSAIGKHVPEKVEVNLGNDYFTVIKWNFRNLIQNNGLKEGDFLVVDPKKEHLKGLAIGRPQWLLRPGDLVPVNFIQDVSRKGFYVPINAISKKDNKHIVYIVINNKAQSIEVTLHDTYRELRRIEGKDLETGMQIIVGGIHYISNKQNVRIVKMEDI
ncbi:MAG: efflux RND transporter periplasmic adaptor subunit [Proteobacteria bacterium]|nr:efflux RND transporter periplasmic adaptor subunit [Pseudomonadota bacterium]